MKFMMLSRLLNKPAPKSYTVSSPEKDQKHYDYLMLNADHPKYGIIFLRSLNLTSRQVHFLWWPDGNDSDAKEATCNFEEINFNSITVHHRYRTWDITYGSYFEAYIHDKLNIPWIKWWFQKFRNLLLKTITPDERMVILKKIIDLQYRGETITVDVLMNMLHGSAIRLSGDQHKHRSHLIMIIESLKESGDISYDDDTRMHFMGLGAVKPTPKSIQTISEFNQSTRRHDDSIRLARSQTILGWGMLLIAATTLIAQLAE